MDGMRDIYKSLSPVLIWIDVVDLTISRGQYSGDWGDYVSLAERLREQADERAVDLIIVDTGDRVEGNGLYDASDPKGQFTYDIFREQEIDIITPGNHELYQADAAAREFEQTVPNFKGNYLASNLDFIIPATGERVPMAQRYRTFITKNQGIRVLAMGFLFNFVRNANNTVVQPVQETIREEWFQEAIRKDVDLFVIAGHVTLGGLEYAALYKAIRNQNRHVPIQFFGGHSHIRDFVKYDDAAYGLQSGRFMETIGWLSLKGIGLANKCQLTEVHDCAAIGVERLYMDNNRYGFYHHTGLDAKSFTTDHGQNVTAAITAARKALKLDHVYGCAPRDLWMNRAVYPSNDSLLSWLSDEVMPEMITASNRKHMPRIGLVNSGAMRFDILRGPFTRDTTYIVSPFSSRFLYIADVPYQSAKRIGALVNDDHPFIKNTSADALGVVAAQMVEGHPETFLDNVAQHPLQQDAAVDVSLTPGYTTRDDFGTDGDDTIHQPIRFYPTPNILETRIGIPNDEMPEVVDLVFIDFIQPWVLRALHVMGEPLGVDDIQVYRSESLTELLTMWIEKNWDKDC